MLAVFRGGALLAMGDWLWAIGYWTPCGLLDASLWVIGDGIWGIGYWLLDMGDG